jgi:hypothetical protein
MKKIRGDKPIGGLIHKYMEISQINSQCSYFYLKQGKMSHFFILSFLVLILQNQRTRGRNKSCTSGGGKCWEKEEGG